jgi:hypothetical protein
MLKKSEEANQLPGQPLRIAGEFISFFPSSLAQVVEGSTDLFIVLGLLPGRCRSFLFVHLLGLNLADRLAR